MIIVTGANGFIGSVMVWELNQRGISDIVVVDTISLEQRNILKHRKYSRFLLKDQLWAFLATPEAQSKVSWIIHMGACSATTETNWEFLKENNVEYSQRIWEWCRDHKKGLIYASSAATYGDGSLGFDDTTDPELLKPLNLYGDSKVIFDRWALKQTSTPPHWYGLKFFNVYGPNEYHKEGMTSVAYKASHQIRANGSLGLFKSYDSNYKDGEQMRDFVYVKDVTRWMAELMDKKPKSGIFNMGAGKARTWLALASAVFNALNIEMKIKWLEMPDNLKNQYQYFTEAKMNKWKQHGMSDSQWPLEKGIHDYVVNHLKDGDKLL